MSILRSHFVCSCHKDDGVSSNCGGKVPRLFSRTILFNLLVSITAVSALASTRIDDPPPGPCDGGASFTVIPIEAPSSAPCSSVSKVVYVPASGGTRARYEWQTTPNTPFVAKLPAPYSSATGFPAASPPDYLSACWSTLQTNQYWGNGSQGYPIESSFAIGSRLNIGLMAAPSPGDFLCPAPTIGQSSLCLVPPGAAGISTDWQGAGRPTLDGVVDLITGAPLWQTTDLELPFGGASFRLTRTRSGHHPANLSYGDSGQVNYVSRGGGRLDSTDRWWDWVGQGWMAGENPILLIDGAMADVIGDGPRTTHLWLDAHHSIPFQQVYHPAAGTQPARMEYECPPRFRARMEHNGTWAAPSGTTPTGEPGLESAVQGHWAVRPTQYDIWLYDGAVHYTFVAIYDDVPPKVWDPSWLKQSPQPRENIQWTTFHDRPFTRNQFWQALDGDQNDPRVSTHNPFYIQQNPGWGIPHYGICVKVEDNAGNRAEITYADSKRISADDPNTTCVECFQDGLARGQIKSITLKSGSNTVWTLVYAHRRFKGRVGLDFYSDAVIANYPEEQYPELYEIHGFSAIDRIYVYAGEVPTAELNPATLTINHLDAPAFDWGGIEPLNYHNAHLPSGATALRTNWQYQVRYHYDGVVQRTGYGSDEAMPQLAKTTVRSRKPLSTSTSPATPASDESVKTTLFVYAPPGDPINPTVIATIPWLRMKFTDDDLGRLMASKDQLGLGWLTPRLLSSWKNEQGSSLDAADEQKIYPFASLRIETATYSDWGSSGAQPIYPPSGSMRSQGYVRADSPEVWSDNHPNLTAGLAHVGSAAAGQRTYRVHRLLVPPDPDVANTSFGSSASAAFGRKPMRSVFAHPFPWASTLEYAFPQASGGKLEYAQSPDLSKSRWISIVDEFPAPRSTQASGSLSTGAYNEALENYSDTTTVKAGQLGRRVVEMNAAGFVLRDRRWQYTADGTVVSGGGLGEQYIYKKVADIFREDEVETLPDSVKNESVLTEHRSVGWSAAEIASEGDTKGLVDFFTYDLLPDPDKKGGKRLELVGQGIQKGSPETPPSTRTFAGKKLVKFTASTNTEIEVQLEFNKPVFNSEFQSISLSSSIDLSYLNHLAGQGRKATVTIQKRSLDPSEGDESQPLLERRLLSRHVIGAPRRLRPDGPWYYPVEKEWYDERGNSRWSASGLVRDPFNPGSTSDDLDILTFTYYDRYVDGPGSGSSRNMVVDASPGTALPYTSESIGSWPESGWSRLPAATGFNWITSSLYDTEGMSDVIYPNGKRWARRLINIPRPDTLLPLVEQQPEDPDVPYTVRKFVFNDLEMNSSGLFTSESVGEVIDYNLSHPAKSNFIKRRVIFNGSSAFSLDFDYATQPYFERLTATKLALDGMGMVRKADMLEWVPGTGWAQIGSKQINDLGEVYRELELDGNITRITRNALGQNLRRYSGTQDLGWVSPTNSLGQTLPYDMVLTDRYEYGAGVTNAWLPTVSRTYQANPTWHREHYDAPPTNDADGTATITQYDWRMRAVRTDSYDRGDPTNSSTPRARTVLTFLDHLNRTRLVVTFGRGTLPTLSGNLDPVALDVNDDLPHAADFYGLSVRPVSVIEMLYGPDGSMTESRTYDMAWSGSGQPPYQAELQFLGHGSQEVFTQRPGVGVAIATLDGPGRVAWQANVVTYTTSAGTAASRQISRTDFTYDRFNNVIETARWDRVVNDSTDTLGTGNAVRTRTVNWHDYKNRLVATAELGTEQAGGYIAGSPVFVRYTQGTTPAGDFHAPAPILNTSTGDVTNIVSATAAEDLSKASVTIYVYDKKGNKVYTRLPNGSVTKSEYTATNRLAKTIENHFDADANRRRETSYTYDIGRVSTIKAHRVAPTTYATAAFQTTKVEYGADILARSDSSGQPGYAAAPVTRNNALIGKMRMPDPDTGAIGTGVPDYYYRYTFAGQVAERIDPRGSALRYFYDDAGRLIAVETGAYGMDSTGPTSSFAPGAFAGIGLEALPPSDRVGYIEYTYNDSGRLNDIRAFTKRATSGRVLISHNRYVYDANGNLTHEYQSLGAEIDSNTPYVTYSWDRQNTATDLVTHPGQIGHTRPQTMGYPVVQGAFTTPRSVDFSYGSTAGDADDLLSRLTSIDTTHAVTNTHNVAKFSHTGASRRSGLRLGAVGTTQAVEQNYKLSSEIGLAGLDMFGRVADLAYRNPSTSILAGAKYTYDQAGNRITAEITQAAVSPYTGNNQRSQLNWYDPLQRLVGMDVGSVDFLGTGGAARITPATGIRKDVWQLDLLGNRVGRPEGAAAPQVGVLPSGVTLPAESGSMRIDLSGSNGIYESQSFSVDEQNRIRAVSTTALGAVKHLVPIHDAAGNLIFDMRYIYQYDAWNRLVQVRAAKLKTEVSIELEPETYWYDENDQGWYFLFSWTPGNYYVLPETSAWNKSLLVMHGPLVFGAEEDPAEYRLVVTGDAFLIAGPVIKKYTYDGLGRLVRTRSPYPSVPEFEPEAYNDPVPEPTAVRSERILYDGIRRLQELKTDYEPNSSWEPASTGGLTTALTREYIWGPGNAHAGVDELLVQYGPHSTVTSPANFRNVPWWVLQDGGGDIVAVVKDNGAGTEGSGTSAVAAQWTYDAYGNVQTAEELITDYPRIRAGHKGLFLDRLDASVEESGGAEPARLEPLAHASYYMRNRWYHPEFGRFIERDPNATAITLVGEAVKHGRGAAVPLALLAPMSMYGDTKNLYEYLQSSPPLQHDALGLFIITPPPPWYVERSAQAIATGNAMANALYAALGSSAGGSLIAGSGIAGVQTLSYYNAEISSLIAEISGRSDGWFGGGGPVNRLIGGGLFDDNFWQQMSVNGLSKFRFGGPTSTQEQAAWTQAMQNGRQTTMPVLGDPRLQEVAKGMWVKKESVVRMNGMERTLHWSEHIGTGSVWDIKYVTDWKPI